MRVARLHTVDRPTDSLDKDAANSSIATEISQNSIRRQDALLILISISIPLIPLYFLLPV